MRNRKLSRSEWSTLRCSDVLGCRHYALLGMLLNPHKALGGDVRDLVGRLFETCSVDDVRSADCNAACLTTYYIEKWIEVEGDKATLGCLADLITSMGRLDVVEVLSQAADEYQNRVPHGDEKRSDTMSFQVTSPPHYPTAKELSNNCNNAKKSGLVGAFKSKLKRGKKPNGPTSGGKTQAPRIFIAYAVDKPDHVDYLQKFANSLRRNGFDARLDKMQSGEGYSNGSQWLLSELEAARYIIVAASPLLWKTLRDLEKAHNQPISNDRAMSINMIMTYIRDDLLRSGCHFGRYLTVLMPGCKAKYTPFVLSPSSKYSWPSDEASILRRLMQVEQFQLAPPGALPSIQSTVITDDLFERGLKL